MSEELSVFLEQPAEALRPNGRAHWCVRYKAAKRARFKAKMRMLGVMREREAQREKMGLPAGLGVPGFYRVSWFFWGGAGPDADNALASCKAYIDGCCDALRVNDRVLDCAGICRVKDRDLAGLVLITFF